MKFAVLLVFALTSTSVVANELSIQCDVVEFSYKIETTTNAKYSQTEFFNKNGDLLRTNDEAKTLWNPTVLSIYGNHIPIFINRNTLEAWRDEAKGKCTISKIDISKRKL
jgi:hypothetical protein